ncbi:MAG: sugar phosphate isomerase/epimerase [Spirochaetes bacterium]|nr:sugar phosphate isomerase/epimerase [Spirochaetota bacterium]
MRRAGIWTNYLVNTTPEEMVPLFAKHGWYDLEFSDEHGHMLLARDGDPAAVGDRFRSFAADHHVAFPQGHLWLAADICAADNGATIDALKRWLDLYHALGIRSAVLHPGGNELIKANASGTAIFDARTAALRALTQHVSGRDISIALENIHTPHAKTADDLIPLVDAFNGKNIGICLDTGHLNIVKGDVGVFVRAAGKRLIALHIADNEGATDQHLMPYGRGTVDWTGFMKAIREVGYDRLMNLEIPGESRCPQPVQLMKLDYIRRMMAYLLEEGI